MNINSWKTTNWRALMALGLALTLAACQQQPAPGAQPAAPAPGQAPAPAAVDRTAPGTMRVYRQRGEVPVDIVHSMRKEDFSAADRFGLTLVYFAKTVCDACARQAPAWETLAATPPEGAKLRKVLEHEVDLDWYDITSHPTFILFRDGREVWRYVGVAAPYQLNAAIKRHLDR